MSELSQYAQVAESLARLSLQHSPAGWHGLLCGALCVDPAERVDITHLAEGDAPAEGEAAALQALKAVREQTLNGLNEAHVGFAPLLPDDGRALGGRAQALAEWCEGFLFSLSGRHPLDLENCSADLREIVRDFTELTRAALADDDDAEEEEGAYTELVEYLRVGAQLVFIELQRAKTPPPVESSAARTLH